MKKKQENFLNSTDKDGLVEGYDVDLLNNFELSAVAEGNIFNFTEKCYKKWKSFFKK